MEEKKKYVDEYAYEFDYSTGTYGGSFSSYTGTPRKSSYGYTSTGRYNSPSSWVQSKFKGWDMESYSRAATSPANRLRKALHTLGRTVNIVENSAGTGERSLSLVWATSEGQHNSPLSDAIVLNPTMITQGKVSEEQFALDYYTGQALMLSAMKRTLHPEAFNQFHRTAVGDKAPTKALWQAQEIIKAKNSVVRDWGGFSPYFDVYEQKTTLELHGNMVEYAQQTMTPEIFANLVAWNSLCPAHYIPVDEQYQPLMDELLGAMVKRVPDAEQFDYAHSLEMRIREVIQEPQPPSSPESGGEDGNEGNSEQNGSGSGGGGSVPNSEQDDSDGSPEGDTGSPEGDTGSPEGDTGQESEKSAPVESKDTPTFIDPTLFGGAVETDDSVKIDQPELNLEDESLKAGNPFNEGDYEQEVSPHYRDLTLQSIGAYRLTANSPSIVSSYKLTVASLRQEIASLRKLLSFRATKTTRWTHGKEEGELDDGSLHKLHHVNPTIWSQRNIMSTPSVAISILVDESGSMARHERYEQVRNVAIVLTEVLKDLKGVHLNVVGHTGLVGEPYGGHGIEVETLSTGDTLVMREMYSKHHNNPYALMAIRAISENLDGYAIEYAAKRLKTDYPYASQHIVIHLSDGQPCPTSIKHTRRCVDKAVQRLGVEVFAIGVDNAYSEATGREIYGTGRNVVINNVMGSLSILKPFLKRVLS